MERKPFVTKVVDMFDAIGRMLNFETYPTQRTFCAELLEGLEDLVFNLGHSAEGGQRHIRTYSFSRTPSCRGAGIGPLLNYTHTFLFALGNSPWTILQDIRGKVENVTRCSRHF